VFPGDDQSFCRFRFPDAEHDEVLSEIASDLEVVATAGAADSARLLDALVQLGTDLIPLDRETEATAYLERALVLARQLGDRDLEITAVLQLGTARQYLGDREQAQALALRQQLGDPRFIASSQNALARLVPRGCAAGCRF
jgi:hypothetical protein